MTFMLLRPFIFLRIKHVSGALNWMNWWLPGLIAAVATVVVALAPQLNVFHASGVFDRLLGFIQNLPGFFIAALAAVATFGRADLDALMPGKPPRVSILYHGRPTEVELTRRRFLCLLFSYLTAMSIAITVLLDVGLPMVDQVRGAVAAHWLPTLRAVAAFPAAFFVSQMVVATLWGLYYLGERMHTPD